MPIHAIGDVQGCDDELAALLARIHFNADRDQLWFVGDLVNRGPQSLAVLRRIHAMRDNAVTVLGNHDLHLLAVARCGPHRLRKADTLGEVLQAPDRGPLLDWLQSRPLLHHDAALGYTLIHAGLPPQWDLDAARGAAGEVERALADDAPGLFKHMYGGQPDCWSPALDGYERLRFTINCLTRLRACDARGRIDLKAKGRPGDLMPPLMPWFRVPGRRSRALKIICGHWSALGLHREDNIVSIDTGCIWGGSLCAWRIDQPAEPVLLACRDYCAPGTPDT